MTSTSPHLSSFISTKISYMLITNMSCNPYILPILSSLLTNPVISPSSPVSLVFHSEVIQVLWNSLFCKPHRPHSVPHRLATYPILPASPSPLPSHKPHTPLSSPSQARYPFYLSLSLSPLTNPTQTPFQPIYQPPKLFTPANTSVAKGMQHKRLTGTAATQQGKHNSITLFLRLSISFSFPHSQSLYFVYNFCLQFVHLFFS